MRHKSFLVAPVFLFLGVIGMKFGWKPNPDLDWGTAFPLWTGAHLAYLAGYLTLGLVLLTLWRWGTDAARSPVDRGAVHALGALSAVGIVGMVGQMVLDLLVGLEADRRTDMSAIFDRYQENPVLGLFYSPAAPSMLFGGLSLLIVLLAVRRRVAVWPAVLFFAGTVAVGTQLTALMVAGGAAIGVALYAVDRERTPVPVGAPH
jgi:hypothetical protein